MNGGGRFFPSQPSQPGPTTVRPLLDPRIADVSAMPDPYVGRMAAMAEQRFFARWGWDLAQQMRLRAHRHNPPPFLSSEREVGPISKLVHGCGRLIVYQPLMFGPQCSQPRSGAGARILASGSISRAAAGEPPNISAYPFSSPHTPPETPQSIKRMP